MGTRAVRAIGWPTLVVAVALGVTVGTISAGMVPQSVEARGSLPLASPVQVVGFSFSPSTVTQGTSTQGSIQFAGGTAPYYAWLNGTPSGCQPPSIPYVTSNTSTTFSCNPMATGTFHIHLDVADSSTPVGHASQSTILTVTGGGNGNGSGNGNGGKGSNGTFSLPGGLLYLVTIFAVVFLGAVVAIAAGVIALAVSVSRRLRQLNETLAAQRPPAPAAKPPT